MKTLWCIEKGPLLTVTPSKGFFTIGELGDATMPLRLKYQRKCPVWFILDEWFLSEPSILPVQTGMFCIKQKRTTIFHECLICILFSKGAVCSYTVLLLYRLLLQQHHLYSKVQLCSAYVWQCDILIRSSLVSKGCFQLTCLKPTGSLLFHNSRCSETQTASTPHTVHSHALRSPFMCSVIPTHYVEQSWWTIL